MAKYIDKDKAYGIVLHYGSYAASAKIADMDGIDIVRCVECVKQPGCQFAQYQGNNGFCSLGEKEDKA